MTQTPMAGILTAKPDYTVMSWRELERRSREDAEAAAELAKRQKANAERKARWASPEYIAEETRKSRAILAQVAEREELIRRDILSLNADYKSAITGMDEAQAYTWFVWTSAMCRDWDMLTGLRDPAAIHQHLREVYPSFPERLMDERERNTSQVDNKPVYSPSMSRTRRSRVTRFKTW